MSKIGKFVFPGEIIKEINSVKSLTVLGPGLKQNEDDPNCVKVTQVGILNFLPPNTYWVEGSQKRYVPQKGDLVVGVIEKKSGDNLIVDIGSAESATLSLLAFEGATKRQKPTVQAGDVVYAKLLNAHREMEPELVCIDSYHKAGTLGVLPKEGFLMKISLKLTYSLLNVENPLLRTLRKKFPYEMAIGLNGRVWIRSGSIKNVLNIVRILEVAEKQLEKDVIEVCRQMM